MNYIKRDLENKIVLLSKEYACVSYRTAPVRLVKLPFCAT